MPDNRYQRQSALDTLGLAIKTRPEPGEEAGVILGERGHRAQICLRGVGGSAFDDAVARVLGVRPPLEPGTTARDGDRTLLWLGPDEWLAVFPDARRGEVLASLRTALAALPAAAVDLSHARSIISLAGRHARSVLQKGCHLDLHPSRFRAGNVAQSKFARCQVLLHQTDDAPAYDLYVSRSFARYLWSWLEDAAIEYGASIDGGAPSPPGKGAGAKPP